MKYSQATCFTCYVNVRKTELRDIHRSLPAGKLVWREGLDAESHARIGTHCSHQLQGLLGKHPAGRFPLRMSFPARSWSSICFAVRHTLLSRFEPVRASFRQ